MIVALIATAVALALTGPAGAHSDAGELSFTRSEQTGPNEIAIEVGIVYADDDHLAVDAAVTATLNGPAGDVVGPVELARVDPNSSLYAATVTVPGPGSWAVTANSTSPEGSVETEVDVIEATVDTTTSSMPATSTTVAPGDDEPGDGTTDGTTDAVTTSSDGTDSGDNRWLLVTAAVAAVAIVAVVALVLRRREGAGDHDDLGEPDDLA